MTKIKNINYILIVAILIFIICGGILSYSLNKKEPVPISKKEGIEKEEVQKKEDEDTIISTPPEEVWKTYTSAELGFSIKYPEMVFGLYSCSPKKSFWVPLKVFEDKKSGIVHIIKEYYYSDWDRESQTKIGPCKKTFNSLKSSRGRRILIEDIKNEDELDKFFKDNYGPGCFAGEKELWKQEGVYEIRRKGEDWGPKTNLGTTTCPWSNNYKILYAPEKNKLMSVNLGQECGFGTDLNSKDYKCYDGEMIDSFRFE